MKTRVLSFRSSVLKSLSLIIMFVLCAGCGDIRYQLVVYAEPELEDADIYIDDRLVKASVDTNVSLYLSNEKHEMKVVQKGFKPFITTLEPPTAEERTDQVYKIIFEPLDSVPTIPSQSDTGKTSK